MLKTILESICRFFIFHLVPSDYLLRRIQRKFDNKNFDFVAEFSGRVALYRLAQVISDNDARRVALIPDYICNVVNIALEQAGFEVQSYAIDNKFEPNRSEIEKRILEDDGVGVFLTASVYGSSAFLHELHDEDFRELVFQRNIHVIVDLCQDITLIDHLPAGYGENLSSVISFNDKSIPGVMGGGILTQLDIPSSTRRPSLYEVIQLYGLLLRKLAMYVLDHSPNAKRIYEALLRGSEKADSHPARFSYSYCRRFPYLIEDVGIARIQIITALIFMGLIDKINMKKRNFALTCPKKVKTQHYETSPYLVVSSFVKMHEKRKRKAPYAIHEHPEQSLRGDLKIIHNKGFCDEI